MILENVSNILAKDLQPVMDYLIEELSAGFSGMLNLNCVVWRLVRAVVFPFAMSP